MAFLIDIYCSAVAEDICLGTLGGSPPNAFMGPSSFWSA